MVVISSLIPAATQIPVWQENYARSEAGDLLLVHESKPHLIGRRVVPRNLKVDGKSLSFLWSKKHFRLHQVVKIKLENQRKTQKKERPRNKVLTNMAVQRQNAQWAGDTEEERRIFA